MKYTKKAYLTVQPPTMEGGGGAPPDMNRLLKTMAMRQEEDKTPYTNQLLRIQDDLDTIMTNRTWGVDEKLKMLNHQLVTYRDFLKKSQALRAPAGAAGVTPAPTPLPPTPRPVVNLNQGTPIRVPPTPKPRKIFRQEEPLTTAELTTRKSLLKAKKQLMNELIAQKREHQTKRVKDSGVGSSLPPAKRTRSRRARTERRDRRKSQTGTGGRNIQNLQKWMNLRFTRKNPNLIEL